MTQESLYPSALEAERAVIGAMMLAEEAVSVATTYLRPEDFYRDAHRVVFESVLALSGQQRGIDLVTLADHLRARGELERIGGIAELGEIGRETGSAANVESHCKLIIDKAQRRRLIQTADRIRQSAAQSEAPTVDVLEAAERDVFEITSKRAAREPRRVGDLLGRTFDRIEELVSMKGRLTGVSTGFPDLDSLTSGLQKSDLIILAARPSMGKTSLAVNIMEAVALAEKRPVVFFSLEMSMESVVLRLLSSIARVPFNRIQTGQLNEAEMTELIKAADRLGRGNFYIDDSVDLSPLDVRSRCRRLASKLGPLGLIVVDYLQLMRSSRRIDNRVQEVSEISRLLKGVARELEAPLLCLSQLSRAPEARSDRRPQLSDLRDSGAIEQDADIVAFIHREDYAGSGGSGEGGEAELLIRKHRNGRTGSVPLMFLGNLMRFESAAREDEYDRETAVVG